MHIPVSLREKGVDLNLLKSMTGHRIPVSLREKGVDLNKSAMWQTITVDRSPFVRREWI